MPDIYASSAIRHLSWTAEGWSPTLLQQIRKCTVTHVELVHRNFQCKLGQKFNKKIGDGVENAVFQHLTKLSRYGMKMTANLVIQVVQRVGHEWRAPCFSAGLHSQHAPGAAAWAQTATQSGSREPHTSRPPCTIWDCPLCLYCRQNKTSLICHVWLSILLVL